MHIYLRRVPHQPGEALFRLARLSSSSTSLSSSGEGAPGGVEVVGKGAWGGGRKGGSAAGRWGRRVTQQTGKEQLTLERRKSPPPLFCADQRLRGCAAALPSGGEGDASAHGCVWPSCAADGRGRRSQAGGAEGGHRPSGHGGPRGWKSATKERHPLADSPPRLGQKGRAPSPSCMRTGYMYSMYRGTARCLVEPLWARPARQQQVPRPPQFY